MIFRFLIFFLWTLFLSGAVVNARPGEIPAEKKGQNQIQAPPTKNAKDQQTTDTETKSILNDAKEALQTNRASNQNQPNSPKEMTLYELLYLVSQYLIFIAALIYTVFACLQWRAIRSQAKIAADTFKTIERQADIADEQAAINRIAVEASVTGAIAARESAKVAELALKGDRPYLFVEQIRVAGFDRTNSNIGPPPPPFPCAAITFKNYGKGPAIIDTVFSAIKIVKNQLSPRDYKECTENPKPNIVGPDDSKVIETWMTSEVTEQDRRLVLEGKTHLVMYGFVKYHSLAEHRYIRGFYWETSRIMVALFPGIQPTMMEGPTTHNYEEEEDTKPN